MNLVKFPRIHIKWHDASTSTQYFRNNIQCMWWLMTSFTWWLCSHHQPMCHKKIKFSKILYINDWLFRHPVQPPCTIFILFFLGAMWLNVKGTLCPISSSPHVEPPSMMPAIPFLSPLWLGSYVCLPSKIGSFFFPRSCVCPTGSHLYWYISVTITNTSPLMQF